jgi:hypothetical protein
VRQRKSMRPSRLALSLLFPFGWIAGIDCAGHTATAKSAAVSIRFAIEVDNDSPGPIYVLLNGSDAQLGWITVYREGERIYFRERCEIEDCGVPHAVCGAAFPEVRNIAGGGDRRSIEFVWDGMTSVRDSLSGCETRRPVSPGQYIARFCYSREAEVEGNGDPLRAVPGRLIDATCIEKPFTLLEREMVLRI